MDNADKTQKFSKSGKLSESSKKEKAPSTATTSHQAALPNNAEQPILGANPLIDPAWNYEEPRDNTIQPAQNNQPFQPANMTYQQHEQQHNCSALSGHNKNIRYSVACQDKILNVKNGIREKAPSTAPTSHQPEWLNTHGDWSPIWGASSTYQEPRDNTIVQAEQNARRQQELELRRELAKLHKNKSRNKQ
uniref:Uncharacterized protein n=1 Tax=Globodera rostochiensis TaxID=31243 RepID=A0A914HMW3_GLORO